MSHPGIKPFFSYYGSKYRIAPKYTPPRYATIVEPFAGSAGYALTYCDRSVVLVDKDPVVAGLWQYLTRVSAAEVMRIPADANSMDDVPGPQEAKWLVGFWLDLATARPHRTRSRGFAQERGWSAKLRERVASQVDRIRHWRVICGSYEDAPDIEATWFIDPPYRVRGWYYKMNSRAIDFPRLGEWCRSRRGQVIVCENTGAGWLPFRPFRRIKGARRPSVEAVWTRDETSIWLREAPEWRPPAAAAPAQLVAGLR